MAPSAISTRWPRPRPGRTARAAGGPAGRGNERRARQPEIERSQEGSRPSKSCFFASAGKEVRAEPGQEEIGDGKGVDRPIRARLAGKGAPAGPGGELRVAIHCPPRSPGREGTRARRGDQAPVRAVDHGRGQERWRRTTTPAVSAPIVDISKDPASTWAAIAPPAPSSNASSGGLRGRGRRLTPMEPARADEVVPEIPRESKGPHAIHNTAAVSAPGLLQSSRRARGRRRPRSERDGRRRRPCSTTRAGRGG